jgi:hypothetical protein
MNALIHILAKSGLLTKDLDYHLLRASMVLIFLAFGYQKWFAYEAQVLIPYISNGPLIFWMYPSFRRPRSQLVSRCFRMGVRHAAIPRILEQATGNLGSHRVDSHFPRRSRSSRSCRMAGIRLPDFQRWPATFLF